MSEWTITVTVATPHPLDEDFLVELGEQVEHLGDGDGSVSARGTDGPGFVLRYTTKAWSILQAIDSTVELAEKLAAPVQRSAIVGASGETAELAERHAFAPDTPELLAATDVAELLGVTRQRVHQLHSERADFPAPFVRLGSGPVWTRPAIEAFAKAWTRKPGRPALVHLVGAEVSSPQQIRQKLLDLGKRRAEAEKRLAEARSKQTKKMEEAASYRSRASKTASASTVKSYLRSADTAERAALVEGRKVAEQSKRLADFSAKEMALQRDFAAAEKRHAAADRRERERQAAAAKRAHEQELRAERARTAAIIRASEGRLTAAMDKIRPPQTERLRILYLTAAPRADLRVDEEIRRVKAAVQAATHRDLIEVEHKPAATTGDLMDGLLRFGPHVVHFSGHANESALVFDTGSDGAGPGQRVTAESFAQALGSVDRPATLVVLNACKSEAQLTGLLSAVPIAIGMSDSISDRDAMAFAARFYSAIAEGQSVQGAYSASKAQMALDGLSDADLPVLVSEVGVSPREVQLVIPPA